MTLSELYEYLLLGGSVKCDSPQQRNTLARLIQDELGLQIGPGTTDYMTRYPDGTDYMFVELYNMSNGAVVSFCVNALGPTGVYWIWQGMFTTISPTRYSERIS